MVQRKRVRKKPQDAVGVSKDDGLLADHAHGGGCLGGRGGDVARASSLPRYMRATRSSGAKAGRGAVGEDVEDSVASPEGREPVRAKMAFAGTPCVSRATCSSSMKGHAAAAGRACPYTYCSLKGHVHATVVPLRSFLASERRLIKTQQSMKQKGVSSFRRTNNGGVGEDGFFIDIFSGATATTSTASLDVSCSDLSTEKMDAVVGRRMDYTTFDHRSCQDAKDTVNDSDVSVDGSCGSSDVISDGLAEFTTKSRDRREEIVQDEDQEAQDFGSSKSDISELDANNEDCGGDASMESSMDDIFSAFGGMNFEDVGSDSTDAVTSRRNKLVISRRRTPTKEAKRILTFNPRAPNFLPVEPEPDVEKVDLRHQLTNDRKSAEEWMVDYALRRAVNKLARAQKRKVEMLVLAFETVVPSVPSGEKSAQQDDEKNFT